MKDFSGIGKSCRKIRTVAFCIGEERNKCMDIGLGVGRYGFDGPRAVGAWPGVENYICVVYLSGVKIWNSRLRSRN